MPTSLPAWKPSFFVWSLVLFGVLAFLIWLPVQHWEAIERFPDRIGNVASVAGLLVSVVGFAITIWTLHLTGRISREAEQKIERAVTDAREETRRAIANIGLHLLESDSEHFAHLIAEIGRQATQRNWLAAVQGCRQAAQAATLLSLHPHLEPGHRSDLEAGVGELEQLATYIQQYRIARTAWNTQMLTESRVSVLQRMAMVVVRIKTGVRNRLLEVPYGSGSTAGRTGGTFGGSH